MAVTSFRQWQANERAMRRRQPLPKSPMALVLSIGIGVIAVIAIVLVFRGSEVGDRVTDDRAPRPGRMGPSRPGRRRPRCGTRASPPSGRELAWGRTGLAVAVAVVVLARRAWELGGGRSRSPPWWWSAPEAWSWLVGMRLSRDLHLHMEPHGLVGSRAFGLVTVGTLLLAIGASVFGLFLPH